MNLEKILEKIEKYLSYGFIFILPFFILSISSNPFTVSKLALVSLFAILYVIIIAVKSIITGKFTYKSSIYDIPILVIAVAYLLSAILRTPNKMEAILLPGTATAIVGGALIYFMINQLKDKSGLSKIIVFSGAVYSAFCILAYLGVFSKIPQLPAFMKAKTYTPEGGYLPSVIFLVTILPLAVSAVISLKDIKIKIATLFSALVIAGGLVLSIYQILPGRPTTPKFPSNQVSWEVSIDALKASPFLGIGPGNYMTAFNRFRPLTFNASDTWAIKYSTASNFYFTLFTETGLLGLAGIILLIWVFMKDSKKQLKENKLVNWGLDAISPLISFTLIVILIAIFPATIFIHIFIFIILALSAKTHSTSYNLVMQGSKEGGSESISPSSKLLAILIFVPVIGATLYIGFLGVNILRGEYYYKTALESLLANDAQGTFNNMRTAVQINPRVDRYRATFARINLILADAIARKKDLTDTDRTTITQLIQASIAEAKACVVLNPLRAQNWEVLGSTYQSIIPLANGADGFAAQAYSQAIALDPNNPQTRIALGGLYYAAKNYETASRVFELAVTVKPDLANSHFNLAFAYKEQGKLDAAIQQMGLVLGIVKPDTPDYEAAKKALEDMQSKKKAAAPVGGENLIPPAVPTPALKPKVELPEGSEPPAAPITETPTPTAAVTPTPAR